MKAIRKNRWAVLALGTVTLLFAGIIYAWSVINVPFSVFADTRNIPGRYITLNYTLTMCSFCIGGFVSGLIGRYLGLRVRMLIAAAGSALGFMLAGTLPLFDSLAPMYIGYGLLAGTGIGFVYNVVIGYVNSLFPDRRGLCAGVLMMGFGLSTLTLGKLMTAAANHMDSDWTGAYLLCGLALGIVFTLFAFVLPCRKEEAAAAQKAAAAGEGLTAGEMVRTAVFWKLFVFFILFAAVGSTAISGAASQFATLGQMQDTTAILLAGILTVCNALGRVASGLVFDRFGLRITQYVTSLVVLTATLLAFAGYRFSLVGMGCIGLCLCGFSYGFSPTLSAAFVTEFFGSSHFPLNFSILNLILIPASFVPTILNGLRYDTLFLVLAAFSAVGFALNLTIRKNTGKE